MELGNIIIGITTVAICVAPFVLIRSNTKKKSNKKLQLLSTLANQHNCTISSHEACGKYIIGIDEDKNHVFFIKTTNKSEILEQYINLADIKSCKVKNVSTKNGPQKVLGKLELVFTPIDQNQPTTIFEFYNTDDSFQLNGELQSIEKWSSKINTHVKL